MVTGYLLTVTLVGMTYQTGCPGDDIYLGQILEVSTVRLADKILTFERICLRFDNFCFKNIFHQILQRLIFGFIFSDGDECKLRRYRCAPEADCVNTVGSYRCVCRKGYVGDGKTCQKGTTAFFLLPSVLTNMIYFPVHYQLIIVFYFYYLHLRSSKTVSQAMRR